MGKMLKDSNLVFKDISQLFIKDNKLSIKDNNQLLIKDSNQLFIKDKYQVFIKDKCQLLIKDINLFYKIPHLNNHSSRNKIKLVTTNKLKIRTSLQ